MRIVELTEWRSKATARKGWVKYATKEKVKICFTKSSLENFKVHTREDFLRLYEKQQMKAKQ